MRVEIDIQDILSEIDVQDLLDEMGDAKLKKYLEARAIKTNIFDKKDDQLRQLFADLDDALDRGDLAEVRSVVDAYARPKWSSPQACERDLIAARERNRSRIKAIAGEARS